MSGVASRVIGVIGAGAMGSGVARRLRENGARVLSPLEGRSEAARARAAAAGMEPVTMADLGSADLVLSIVPPAQALGVARSFAAAAPGTGTTFVDCNALDVRTVEGVGAAVHPIRFADAGIIGLPPVPGGAAPTIYVSGDPAPAVSEALGALGLPTVAMDGPVGAASALKMSYAGITKGLTALASLMLLGAERAGAGPALRAELARSQPQLLARFEKGLPDMLPKAYRWVAEMREIAAFLEGDAAGPPVFEAFAGLYDRLADAEAGAGDVETIRAFARGDAGGNRPG